MISPTLIALLPVGAMIIGGGVGCALGRWASPRASFWVLGQFSFICLAVIIYLATIGPGEEQQAFTPFAWLTAGLFPALLAGVSGWAGGRALRRRAVA